MTQTEALRLALEALESTGENDGYHGVTQYFDERMVDEAIAAIKTALEAKDEPDKYAMDIECTKCGAKQSGVLTVHTTPPQRKPLTDEEIAEALGDEIDSVYMTDFRRVEAKLKEKNT